MLRYSSLSKNDTNILKGFSLLLIMLHNYYHIIPPIPGQNEFAYHEGAFDNFLFLIKTTPFDFIRHSFSYLGHYGVTIFIFTSAYGLFASYKNKNIVYWDFLKTRILKLYPTLLIVVLLLILFISIYKGGLPVASKLNSLLLKLTLVFNFLPGEALEVDGPLWFFSVIVQLYALFPLLKYITKKYGENSMLIISCLMVVVNMLINPILVKNDLSTYFLFTGRIPVFCLGIYFAARPDISIRPVLFVMATAVFLWSNTNQYVWHLSFLSFTIIILSLFILIKPLAKKPSKLSLFLAYTGSISLSLFAVHGMVRFPFEVLAEKYAQPAITSMIALAFLFFVYIAGWVIRLLEHKVQQYIAGAAINK